MSKKYFQGKYGFSMLVEKKPALKKAINEFLPYEKSMYLETEDGFIGTTPLIKIVSSNDSTFSEIVAIATKIKTAKITDAKGNKFIVAIGSDKFYLYKSGGRLQNVIDSEGNATTAKVPSTHQQEDAVRFALEYYSKNKEHPPKEELNRAIKFEFGKDWHESFKKTVEAIVTIIPNSIIDQYVFFRDSNPKKIELLNRITDPKVLPDSKDNWNPSDIWAVKKDIIISTTKQVEELYTNLLNKRASIEDLNKFVETKLKSKEIIGISLKKVAGTRATITKIEVDSRYSSSIKFVTPSKKFQFKVSNSYFDFLLDFSVLGETVKYRFRFRPRGASGELNTYGEGQPQDAKVWDGAISRDMLNTEFPGMLKITREMKSPGKMPSTVSQQLSILSTKPEYKEFAKYIKADNFRFVQISGIDDEISDYEVRRGIVLLYYIYTLETANNSGELYKKMYLASKKMNAFSSVHYKVY